MRNFLVIMLIGFAMWIGGILVAIQVVKGSAFLISWIL